MGEQFPISWHAGMHYDLSLDFNYLTAVHYYGGVLESGSCYCIATIPQASLLSDHG